MSRTAAARLALLGAGLLAHEAIAVAVFLPLILFRFPPRELALHGALICAFVFPRLDTAIANIHGFVRDVRLGPVTRGVTLRHRQTATLQQAQRLIVE